mmetsp:Transcript_11683/g.49174  ORF Transcript_11683/g.49174 Transcript_11683/m.49174 type:complete len:255 (-) Transcript_11683:86-850(-)|eukprot:PRCOL_00006257-RA
MPTQDEMRVKLQMDAYTAVCKAMYAMDEGSVKGGEVLGMLRGLCEHLEMGWCESEKLRVKDDKKIATLRKGAKRAASAKLGGAAKKQKTGAGAKRGRIDSAGLMMGSEEELGAALRGDPLQLMGKSLLVYWLEEGWAEGVVTDYNALEKTHCVTYNFNTKDESFNYDNLHNLHKKGYAKLLPKAKIDVTKAVGNTPAATGTTLPMPLAPLPLDEAALDQEAELLRQQAALLADSDSDSDDSDDGSDDESDSDDA